MVSTVRRSRIERRIRGIPHHRKWVSNRYGQAREDVLKGSDEQSVVRRAQQGDRDAFSELVVRYQDLVAGTAYGWLGDAEAARDAAQETFLDAYQHLGQLKEPRAFGAWLKRIAVKHCDRQTRRRAPAVEPLHELPEPASNDPGPDGAAEARSVGDRLRYAVESLPAAERQVVALHYFAEASGPELAAFLELPLSTVKKRLRSARARLRTDGDRLMKETMDRLRPSTTGKLDRVVSFFIALRAGDGDTVRRMLDDTPSLVDARAEWDPALVFEGLLPFANRATALIAAVELDDLGMLELLLDAGADVNGECGCETGESPLWAATLFNRPDHVRCLLARGADPNRPSAAGNYPLHLAAMRGREQLARLLLAHGADPQLRDSGARYVQPLTPLTDSTPDGRTAADWARANGHETIVAMLQQPGAESRPPVSPGAVRFEGDRIHTGIRALDLLAPLKRGGIVRFPFKAGVGMVVLLGELCRRFAAAPRGEAIWTGFAQPPFDLADWQAEMAEFGLTDIVRCGLASFNDAAADRRAAFDRGLDLAEALRDDGRDVLAVVLSTEGFDADVEANLMRLADASQRGTITTIVVTGFPERNNVWTELQPPYAGQIALDRRRARRYLFPALDPERCLSALSDGSLGERQVRLVRAVRQQLRSCVESDPEFSLLDVPTGQQSPAARLLRYFCQPFFVTEAFSGRAGEWTGRDQLLDEVEQLAG